MAIKILMVAGCSKRGKGPVAYIGDLISYLKKDNTKFEIDLLVTSMSSNSTKDDFEVDNFVLPRFPQGLSFMRKIPRIRVWAWQFILSKYFQDQLSKNQYDFVVFHSIPSDVSRYVKFVKRNKTKVVLYPWGSEILRASDRTLNSYKYAFENADYIRGDSFALFQKINEHYDVNKESFIKILYGSNVISGIKRHKEKFTRSELIQKIGLSDAAYYIVCGYNAYEGQCHEAIINQLALVKEYLPSNYELVFPYTYGKGPSVQHLKSICQSKGLRAEFLVDYLTDDQMAYLHLITDLFIHVQETDIASSYLYESIYAGCNIINGAWLKYADLEMYGSPFYTTPSLDSLHKTLVSYFGKSTDVVHVDSRVLQRIEEESWESAIQNWVKLFKNLSL